MCAVATVKKPKTNAFSPVNTSHGHQFSSFCSQYAAPPEGVKASARHILVKSKDQVSTVLDQLQGGAKFADVARDCSSCPSGKQGGSLGSFSPGTMVPAFDKVIFSADTKLGEVVGPVKTEVSVVNPS